MPRKIDGGSVSATKSDFKKELDAYQAKRGAFRVVDVPELQYLMIDGHGDPNTSPEYTRALEALYPIAYAMKFASKRELGRDYVVMPLEGLWWADDMSTFTSARDKSQWDWTMMIMVPEWLSEAAFTAARDQAAAKYAAQHAAADPHAEDSPPFDEVRLATLREGRCVQTLHVGSYEAEAPVLERMHREFIPAQGLRMAGTHHEIYLSDPRKVAPERLRTILRQPVTAA
ncbi:hypothetical protein G7067_07680 [Leucobacter insecticola]|uniref:GyrI-like small molecule binding domain-containing protein n=1 Tax=Leucobacter insecticola TaxID=2714934 RepID=A0A6G8FJ69_9MICO|nr:GyrI-like domain-containing protein [Leucobacter insecticola]QIM16329.1 hypothetical protein G7067_07680 [Leucobacter insecticola]